MLKVNIEEPQTPQSKNLAERPTVPNNSSLNLKEQRKLKDPNNLNFKQLHVKYVEETTTKLKFTKASFLHYC